MRILAIRGANLASLEGEFELDLAEGPLARAGVFAICGPTGAGKSTLLDAMCLALFDAVPRLVGASRVRIGREDEDEAERLTASDSRWILRKGVGSGFAEVDFLGVDRRRYRARWELRRAHGRANGKLQSTGMSLVDLDDARTVAGDRKTDVKRAIEEKLGLTFDQFRRSVLLAQNDFAAFLDADAKERAGLLERMTGTEIYGLISIEAHERAVREREELRRLEERASYYTLLSDEERAELEQRAEALGQSAAREQKRMREAESALRWYAQLEGLREEEESARREKERVERQLALAESKRRQVEAYESALPLRPFLEALDRARAELLAREGELALAAEAHAAAEARAETARQAHGEAAAEAERAERALTESAPALAEARVLDGQLARLREELAAAERRRAAREADLATREEKLRSLERTMADARAEADRARVWLEAHPAAGALAERWDRTEARLERLAELAREERAHVDERLAMERALSERRAQRDAHAAVYAEAERARREASTRYEEALAAARAAPSEALTEVRSRCMSRHTALERMLGVAELAERAADDARRLRDEAERAAVEAERAERAAKEAADERARVWARLEEARRTRDRLRSTLDLAGRRAELVDGEPCPLCGATEHPYAHAAPAVERLLAAQDERTSELEAELSSLHQREADQRRAAAMHRDAERKAREEAGKRSADLAEARERYAELARTLATDGAPWPEELPSAARPANAWGPLLANVGGAADGPLLDAAARAALEAARDEAERTLRALDEEERARRACEREAEERREALERARAAAAQASEALSASERECTELARKIEELDARIAAIRERAAAIADELAPELSPLPAWRERLAQDPALLLSEARREVEARREKTAALEAAERRARELAPALEAAREQRDAARHELDDARGAHDALARALQEKQRARDALLGGRDADAHEAALRAALDEARARVRRTLEELDRAKSDLAEANARRMRADEALREAKERAERAADELARELAGAGIEEAEARTRLSHEPEVIEGFRRDLAELDRKRARLAAVLEERTRRRAAHEEKDPPKLTREEARQTMSDAEQKAKDAKEQELAARQRLAGDDEARAARAALTAELAARHERLAVWESLDQLIGSATGAKFRVFAQSLTLELLLEHANHHLAVLAPRYALSRVPGQDLAIMVIDHDMGDEVRSVESLSGGETFLVALGMALGLASLSSGRAQVGSLFIDEGFGALDPASLDLVLSALDALQATGRQVGLISHVPTIAERFDTRVTVTPAGPARSRVELVEGPPR